MTDPVIRPAMRIELYSHGMRVYGFDREGKRAILEFCRGIAKFGYKRVGPGRFVYKMLKIFAGATLSYHEFRFHRYLEEDFRQHLKSYGYTDANTVWTEKPLYEPVQCEFPLTTDKEPRDYQIPIIEYMSGEGKTKVVTMQTGKGKMQPEHSAVRVPGGWRTIGELQVGDEVLAHDGSHSKVIGVYPHGMKAMYDIVFEDGRSTECGLEHLWEVTYNNEMSPSVITTEQMIETLADAVSDLYIPLPSVEVNDLGEIPFEITPALLGQHLTTVWRTQPLIEGFPDGHDKYAYIPEEYLEGSPRQRRELLYAILRLSDSQQDLGQQGEWSCLSRRLLSDVQYLVRSLGGKAKIVYGLYGPQSALLYHLPAEGESLKLKVVGAMYSGMQSAKCIAIDHPQQLYVTDDFIVTHNTMCALWAIARRKTRTMLVISNRYLKKWKSDVIGAYGLKPSELLIISGTKQFKSLINMAKAGELEAKFIIVSGGTIYNFLKAHEMSNGDTEQYGVAPEDLYETLGVGVRLIDEVHEDFLSNHRQDIYANVPCTISLSATLMSDDKAIDKMFRVTFPMHVRPQEIAYDKYVVLKCLLYHLDYPNKLRHKNAMKQYSHVKFEQSLMKQPNMLNNYFKLVEEVVKVNFIPVREKGQRMMIYFATVEMCTIAQKRLERLYPELKVVRYVRGDSYEQFLEADISCTTLKSAGTAVDVEGLRFVLNTVNLSTTAGNTQALGRLRRLKDWPDVTPEFLFLCAQEIEAHRRYAEQKTDKLGGKVLSYKILHTGMHV